MEIATAVQGAKQGEQSAFNYLLDRFWVEVYGFLIKRTHNENDAEDIAIQTFSKAFDRIDTFDENYKFSTWLITIAKNLHIDFLRKKKNSMPMRDHLSESEEAYNIIDSAPSPEDLLIGQQNLAALLKIIKTLKPSYQEVINLRYFKELSYKEIAVVLGESVTNVKVKTLRARKLLIETIQNQKEL